MTLPEPGVSDHALLRFIERAYKVDIDELKARMLTPLVVNAIKAGALSVTVEGIKFMVARDGTITTVLDSKPWGRKKRMRSTDRPRGAGREIPPDDTHERVREHEEHTEDADRTF